MTTWPRRLWFGDGISPHGRIHEGKMFHMCHLVRQIANNGSILIGLTTAPQKLTNIFSLPVAGGLAEFNLHEGAVYSGGTPVQAHNLKRNSTAEYAGSLVHTPTVATLSHTLMQRVVPGGQGGNSVGSESPMDTEWLLAPSTSYLYELINRSGVANDMSLSLLFYTTHPGDFS